MRSLANTKIILASASPRRSELLSGICADLVVAPQEVDEVYSATTPHEIVMELSALKLANLPAAFPNDLVIASDTIVWYQGRCYGKPSSPAHANQMLAELAGNTHQVFTGFSVALGGKIVTDYDCCEITFRNISEQQIVDYIATRSPLDKAGAYGVQDGVCVDSYKGDINTIIGLPLAKVIIVCEELLNHE